MTYCSLDFREWWKAALKYSFGLHVIKILLYLRVIFFFFFENKNLLNIVSLELGIKTLTRKNKRQRTKPGAYVKHSDTA